jgi:hypothetical protein
MRRAFPLLVMTGLLVPFAASAGTAVGWSVTIGNAPPPPVVEVREEPHVVLVPNSTVYAVDDDRCDYDAFRYGVFWYVSKGDYWYRARRWGGPYAAISARYVPRAIYTVPASNWRYHHPGPRGFAYGYYRDRDRYEDRRWYRDYDRRRDDRPRNDGDRAYDPRRDHGRDSDVADRGDRGKNRGRGKDQVADRDDNDNPGRGHGHNNK